MADRSSATYPASARRQHPDPERSIARSSATPATLVLTVWIIGIRCGLEDRSASRKGASIKPGRTPEPDRVCKAPQAIDLQVPELTIPGIAQLPHQRRFLISCLPDDLIPGVLVQMLSHPLRSARCHNYNVMPVQRHSFRVRSSKHRMIHVRTRTTERFGAISEGCTGAQLGDSAFDAKACAA